MALQILSLMEKQMVRIAFRSFWMALSLGAIIAGAQEKPAAGIQWAEDLPSAMARSAVDGRPVIAYFTFDT